MTLSDEIVLLSSCQPGFWCCVSTWMDVEVEVAVEKQEKRDPDLLQRVLFFFFLAYYL